MSRVITTSPWNWRVWLLALALLGQLSVLVGEYLLAQYPLWVGESVTLRMQPRDPRDLFRGNYARLQYDISQLSPSLLNADQDPLRDGARVYLSLAVDEHGIAQPVALSLTAPATGPVIRGRVRHHWGGDWMTVEYGIEAWFAPLDKALALERDLMQGGLAEVKLTASGRAALVAVGPLPEGMVAARPTTGEPAIEAAARRAAKQAAAAARQATADSAKDPASAPPATGAAVKQAPGLEVE